jgi:hypothetical protein
MCMFCRLLFVPLYSFLSNILKFILTAASFIKRVARWVVFCVVFVLYIIVYPCVLFSFTHCIVCRFSIFGFWLWEMYVRPSEQCFLLASRSSWFCYGRLSVSLVK